MYYVNFVLYFHKKCVISKNQSFVTMHVAVYLTRQRIQQDKLKKDVTAKIF